MSFNTSNFNESLKYTYQQFSKQEADAREHSRQLLLRLDRFEAKALDLGARTKKALQIKNHYERTLMHQHPLVWAHIQRGLVYNIGDIDIRAGFTEALPMRSTKEMAINTSLSSSPSDQNSLHEAVWPNSPSPYPDERTGEVPTVKAQITHQARETLRVNEDIPDMEQLNITRTLDTPGKSEIERTRLIQSSHQENLNILEKKEKPRERTTLRTSPQHAERDLDINYQQFMLHEIPPSPEHTSDKRNQPELVPSSWGIGLTGSASKATSSEEVNIQEIQDDQLKDNPSPNESKDLKTFRLDSESDCPDDPISGPSAGQVVEGDDSDSFWG